MKTPDELQKDTVLTIRTLRKFNADLEYTRLYSAYEESLYQPYGDFRIHTPRNSGITAAILRLSAEHYIPIAPYDREDYDRMVALAEYFREEYFTVKKPILIVNRRIDFNLHECVLVDRTWTKDVPRATKCTIADCKNL